MAGIGQKMTIFWLRVAKICLHAAKSSFQKMAWFHHRKTFLIMTWPALLSVHTACFATERAPHSLPGIGCVCQTVLPPSSEPADGQMRNLPAH